MDRNVEYMCVYVCICTYMYIYIRYSDIMWALFTDVFVHRCICMSLWGHFLMCCVCMFIWCMSVYRLMKAQSTTQKYLNMHAHWWPSHCFLSVMHFFLLAEIALYLHKKDFNGVIVSILKQEYCVMHSLVMNIIWTVLSRGSWYRWDAMLVPDLSCCLCAAKGK